MVVVVVVLDCICSVYKVNETLVVINYIARERGRLCIWCLVGYVFSVLVQFWFRYVFSAYDMRKDKKPKTKRGKIHN